MKKQELDETKRRRRGPLPKDSEDRRNHTVSVRLNPSELKKLDEQREKVSMDRGEYLRVAGLHRLPPTIPEINREAWSSLVRVSANLNQYQAAINGGLVRDYPDGLLSEVKELVQFLRRDLIRLRIANEVNDES